MIDVEKKFKYQYTICNVPDDDLFKKQCEALEKHISNLSNKGLVEDVDLSSYQHYSLNGKELVVKNDYYIGCLYIDSDFDIEPYFQK